MKSLPGAGNVRSYSTGLHLTGHWSIMVSLDFITLGPVHIGGDCYLYCQDYRGRHQCRCPENPI
jgi:hypothetical protein